VKVLLGGQVGKGVGKLTGEGTPKALPSPSRQVIPREYFQQMNRERPLTNISRWQQQQY
jgi:hypothetical protein